MILTLLPHVIRIKLTDRVQTSWQIRAILKTSVEYGVALNPADDEKHMFDIV